MCNFLRQLPEAIRYLAQVTARTTPILVRVEDLDGRELHISPQDIVLIEEIVNEPGDDSSSRVFVRNAGARFVDLSPTNLADLVDQAMVGEI